MAFDPDVVALFAQLQQAGAPPMEALPLAEARAMMRGMSAQLGFPVLEMQVRDLRACTASGNVPLRLYRPPGLADDPAPTCLFVHGGGGVVGDLDSHDDICRQLAARVGCQVLAVDYRLAPEHPAPAGVEDVIAVLRWLVAHPQQVGADLRRLAVAGDSMGGSIAAVVALVARPAMRFFNQHLFQDAAITHDWRMSPLLAPDVAGVAPALIVLAELDILHDEGLRYAERLGAAGVEVSVQTFPGMIHGFFQMGRAIQAAETTMELCAQMLRQRLLPL